MQVLCGSCSGILLHLDLSSPGLESRPQISGRVSAQATRFTQALAPTDRLRQQTYTDDPWLAIRGSQSYISRLTAVVVMTWLALGFP